MSHVDFFRKQSKNFLKDWKTQTKTVEDDGLIIYHYKWKFFDLDDLLPYFELNNKEEQDIKLARAQHYIAKMVGYKKWNDLIQASEKEQELAELLLRHFKSSSDIEDWSIALDTSGIKKHDVEAVLDYAKQFFSMNDSVEMTKFVKEEFHLLHGKERLKELKQQGKDFQFTFSTRIHCIHCGRSFFFKEANVIKTDSDNSAWVVCKHYPSCNGTLIDFIDEDDEYGGKVPFDWDMDQGYISEYAYD